MATKQRETMLGDLTRYSVVQATVTLDRQFHADYGRAIRRLDNEQLAKEWRVYCS